MKEGEFPSLLQALSTFVSEEKIASLGSAVLRNLCSNSEPYAPIGSKFLAKTFLYLIFSAEDHRLLLLDYRATSSSSSSESPPSSPEKPSKKTQRTINQVLHLISSSYPLNRTIQENTLWALLNFSSNSRESHKTLLKSSYFI